MTLLPQRFVMVQFGLFTLIAAALLIFPRSASPVAVVTGLVFIAAAVVILVLAVRAFQQQARTLPNITPKPNQQTGLVQTGIYQYIRHPIYTAVVIGAFGAALMHGEALIFVLVAVLLGFFTVKSIYEEKLLSAAFPEYADYRAHTGRFLPFL